MPKIIPQRRPASANKNVRSCALSKNERAAIAELRVVAGVGRKGSCSSRPRSEVWHYLGYLHVAKDDAGPSTSSGSGSGVSYEPLNDDVSCWSLDSLSCAMCSSRL